MSNHARFSRHNQVLQVRPRSASTAEGRKTNRRAAAGPAGSRTVQWSEIIQPPADPTDWAPAFEIYLPPQITAVTHSVAPAGGCRRAVKSKNIRSWNPAHDGAASTLHMHAAPSPQPPNTAVQTPRLHASFRAARTGRRSLSSRRRRRHRRRIATTITPRTVFLPPARTGTGLADHAAEFATQPAKLFFRMPAGWQGRRGLACQRIAKRITCKLASSGAVIR